MVLDKPLEGRFVNLRSVTEDDAEFILQIRNDPKISKYLPPLNVTIEQQKEWIKRQREADDDYYFIIEDRSSKSLGTISVYNVRDGVAETGRFCSFGEAQHNVEASIMLYDFCFGVLDIDVDEIWVYEENRKVCSYDKKFGAIFYRKGLTMDGRVCILGNITKKNYISARSKVVKVIETL